MPQRTLSVNELSKHYSDLKAVHLNRENKDFLQINVPGDGSCLFYAVAMSALFPLLEDDVAFAQMCHKLFGKNIKHNEIKNTLLNCHEWMDKIHKNTHHSLFFHINKDFRELVVDLVKTQFNNQLKPFLIEDKNNSNKKQDFSDYLAKMRKPTTYGGEPELSVMSKLLERRIVIYSQTGNVLQYTMTLNKEKFIKNPPLYLLYQPVKDSPKQNHYQFLLLPEHFPITDELNKIVLNSKEQQTVIANKNSLPSSASKTLVDISIELFDEHQVCPFKTLEKAVQVFNALEKKQKTYNNLLLVFNKMISNFESMKNPQKAMVHELVLLARSEDKVIMKSLMNAFLEKVSLENQLENPDIIYGFAILLAQMPLQYLEQTNLLRVLSLVSKKLNSAKNESNTLVLEQGLEIVLIILSHLLERNHQFKAEKNNELFKIIRNIKKDAALSPLIIYKAAYSERLINILHRDSKSNREKKASAAIGGLYLLVMSARMGLGMISMNPGLFISALENGLLAAEYFSDVFPKRYNKGKWVEKQKKNEDKLKELTNESSWQQAITLLMTSKNNEAEEDKKEQTRYQKIKIIFDFLHLLELAPEVCILQHGLIEALTSYYENASKFHLEMKNKSTPRDLDKLIKDSVAYVYVRLLQNKETKSTAEQLQTALEETFNDKKKNHWKQRINKVNLLWMDEINFYLSQNNNLKSGENEFTDCYYTKAWSECFPKDKLIYNMIWNFREKSELIQASNIHPKELSRNTSLNGLSIWATQLLMSYQNEYKESPSSVLTHTISTTNATASVHQSETLLGNEKTFSTSGDFRKIREGNHTFIDKTLLIKDVLDDNSEVIVFVRPSGFCKSTNLSMIAEYLRFYSNETTKKQQHQLFNGYKIHQVDTGKYKKHMGQYPVIYLNFEALRFTSKKTFKSAFQTMISELYQFHISEEIYTNLAKRDQKYCDEVLGNNLSAKRLQNSLKNLCKYIHSYYQNTYQIKNKVVLLIDEYDTPVLEANLNIKDTQEKDRILGILNMFVGPAVKGNRYIEKAILTGILRISGQALMSGAYNNCVLYTVLSDKYSTYFGFTPKETAMVFGQQWEQIKETFIKWYGYYRTGKSVSSKFLLRPASVIKCANNDYQLEKYMIGENRPENRLIRHILTSRKSTEAIKNVLLTLLRGEQVKLVVNESLDFSDATAESDKLRITFLLNYLLFSGYVSWEGQKKADGRIDTNSPLNLRITNNEVTEFFKTLLKRELDLCYTSIASRNLLLSTKSSRSCKQILPEKMSEQENDNENSCNSPRIS